MHDTVEDTNTSFEEIEQIFGRAIASIVREVTDDKTIRKQNASACRSSTRRALRWARKR
ncbi:MAG: hypothetical protein M3O41_17945 [Pseudomonadota bacterium]|nr:hypothetical protein [Pseudomonadota bacterium]